MKTWLMKVFAGLILLTLAGIVGIAAAAFHFKISNAQLAVRFWSDAGFRNPHSDLAFVVKLKDPFNEQGDGWECECVSLSCPTAKMTAITYEHLGDNLDKLPPKFDANGLITKDYSDKYSAWQHELILAYYRNAEESLKGRGSMPDLRSTTGAEVPFISPVEWIVIDNRGSGLIFFCIWAVVIGVAGSAVGLVLWMASFLSRLRPTPKAAA